MKANNNYALPCGLVLIAICLFIRYHIGRRKFNRRVIGGMQYFSNYSKAVTTTFLETLILFVGNLCGLAGVLLTVVAGFNHFKL